MDQLRASCEQCLPILWRQPGTLQVCSRGLCPLPVSGSGEASLLLCTHYPSPTSSPDSLTLTGGICLLCTLCQTLLSPELTANSK